MSLGSALRGRPTPGRPLGGGEDDAAGGVVPGVGLVLAEDRELDAVDDEEFVEGESEGHGGEDVNLDEGLAAGVVGAEGDVSAPRGGQVGEELRAQPRVGLGPGVAAEGIDVVISGDGAESGEVGSAGFPPEIGVVGGQTERVTRPEAEGRVGATGGRSRPR